MAVAQERRYLMNAAVPRTRNARTKSQTTPIPTIIAIDIPVISIIIDLLRSLGSSIRERMATDASAMSERAGRHPAFGAARDDYCDRRPIKRVHRPAMRVTCSVKWVRLSVDCSSTPCVVYAPVAVSHD